MRIDISKNLYKQRIIFAVLIVITAVLGHSRGLIPQINGVNAMAIVPLVVCIAMFERSMFGLLFGAFAGVVWDSLSVTGDGFFSVTLAAVGFFCGALVTYQLRNNIVSALILGFASTSICAVGYWIFFVFMKEYDDAKYILFRYYIPSIFYTMIFVFIYYYLIVGIVKLTAKQKRRINY